MPRSAFDEIREDEYSVASDAAELGRELIAEFPDAFGHLESATVGYLFRDDEVRDHETAVVVASAHLFSQLISGGGTKYFGRLVKWAVIQLLGFQPDFLILIDRNLWSGFDRTEKRFYLDHELEHCIQKKTEDDVPRFNQVTGEPVWGIKPHDQELFYGTMQRHGLVPESYREMAGVVVDAALRDAEKLKPKAVA